MFTLLRRCKNANNDVIFGRALRWIKLVALHNRVARFASQMHAVTFEHELGCHTRRMFFFCVDRIVVASSYALEKLVPRQELASGL